MGLGASHEAGAAREGRSTALIRFTPTRYSYLLPDFMRDLALVLFFFTILFFNFLLWFLFLFWFLLFLFLVFFFSSSSSWFLALARSGL